MLDPVLMAAQEAFLEIAIHKTSARFDVTVARGKLSARPPPPT